MLDKDYEQSPYLVKLEVVLKMITLKAQSSVQVLKCSVGLRGVFQGLESVSEMISSWQEVRLVV